MKVGDLVKWSWCLGNSWERTQFQGIIVDSRIARTEHEEIRIFYVVDNLGEVTDVREDVPDLEMV